MPSSLTRVFPRTLGFSPRLPVSVYGTGGSVLARSFSWQCGIHEFVKVSFNSPSPLTLLHGGFPCHTGYGLGHALPAACSCALLRHSIAQTDCSGTGISTCSPSPMRLCLGLGPTYPETTIVAQEPSGFRWAGFSPAFSILIPAFSLLTSPRLLTVPLLRDKNAPLPRLQAICHSFGSVLEPRTSSAQRLSTSELLRTL